jgi:ATP-binding cassette subfamily B multidrug efflux pump
MMNRHDFALQSEARKAQDTRKTLAQFAGYFRPYWVLLIAIALLVIGSTYIQVLTPALLGQAVDCYLTPATAKALTGGNAAVTLPAVAQSTTNCWLGAPGPNATSADYVLGLGKLVLLLIGLFAAGSFMTGLQFYLMNTTGFRVLRNLRVKIFSHIHRLSVGYFSEHEAGDLMTRITLDADTIQQAVGFPLVSVIQGVLLIVWVAASMLERSWAYALLSLSVMPIMFFATSWFSNQARKAFRNVREAVGDVNANLQERIAAVRETQAFGREQENIAQFNESNAASRDASIRAVAFTSALAPTLEALGYVSIAIVAGVGGWLLLQGHNLFGTTMSLGLIITFIAYVQRFNQPISQISVMWTNIQSAIAGAERIFGLLDTEPDLQDRLNAREMPAIQGRVEFDDVYAEYKPGEPVLKDVNLTVEPGQAIAIVGPTGAGKTTIANLIPRFYEVKSGAVKIDGIDVRDVTAASLRKQIGIVLQDPFLFSDTIMENIRYGQPTATEDQVIAAAKLARADSFIERLPEKYNTKLGERGGGLSQGQRQLLSIARAALANPRILILDEATSSVDTRTERLIQKALEELLRGRTSFVIAHRLSTIRNADQVLVIKDGQIIERGKHEELLRKHGFYYDLYMSQFRRDIDLADTATGNKPAPATA